MRRLPQRSQVQLIHRPTLAAILLAACGLWGCGEEPAGEAPLDPEVAKLIHDYVDGPDAATRAAAYKELPKYGKAIVVPLARALDRDDVDDGAGAEIAELLGDLGPEAVEAAPALGRRLLRGGMCCATTSWALETMGEPGLQPLIRAMASEHLNTRTWASDAIGDLAVELKERAAPAVDSMLKALGDPDAQVRANALHALGNIGPPAKRAADRIVPMLHDADGSVVIGALDAVAQLDLLSGNALHEIRTLMRSIDEDRGYAREWALETIREHVEDDAVAIPLLRLGLDDAHEEEIRFTAVESLLIRGVDEPELVSEYATGALDLEAEWVIERAATLVLSGPNGRRAALPLLVRALDYAPEEQWRIKAAEMLAATGAIAAADTGVMKALAKHADEKNEEPAVANAAKAALAKLRAAGK